MIGRGKSGLVSRYTALVIVTLVIVSGVVGYYVLDQPGTSASSSSTLTRQSTADSVLAELANVSPTTLTQVGFGAPGVSSPKPVDSMTPLAINGKPEVLYVGAEYCPFCAAERWALIVALDKFGSFSGIAEVQSAPLPEAYPNTPTFTFRNATYTSNYISFVSVEQQDRNHNRLQNVTDDQTALIGLYDYGGFIPFIDYANKFTQVGSQFQPSVLTNANWTQVASQLNNASSSYALSIDAASNRIISAICKVDGGSPTSVCSQPFASTLNYVRSSQSGLSPVIASDVSLTGVALVFRRPVRALGTTVPHSILSPERPVLVHAS
jgi:hypothetical protein